MRTASTGFSRCFLQDHTVGLQKRSVTMKFLVMAVIGGCLSASAESVQTQQQDNDRICALLSQFMLDLNTVKLELTRHMMEFHAWKVAALEQRLQEVRKERAELDHQDRMMNQAIIEYQNQGSHAGTDQPVELWTAAARDMRDELERSRTTIQESNSRLNASLNEQLRQERARLEDRARAAALIETETARLKSLPGAGRAQ
jgi:hypothetical protein